MTDMQDLHPEPLYTYIVEWLRDVYPNIAYLHLVEPRVSSAETVENLLVPGASNTFLRNIWQPRALINSGAFERSSAIERVEQEDGLIAFGRLFVSNVSASPMIDISS